MSISSTRKVSGATLTTRKNDRLYASNNESESFVEHIDTANNVLIKKDFDGEHQNNQEYQQQKKEQADKTDVSGNQPQTYVASALEALEASGAYEEPEENTHARNVNNIGIYGNNQSMISSEQKERKNQSYLKHFYEKNEPFEEVNRLV